MEISEIKERIKNLDNVDEGHWEEYQALKEEIPKVFVNYETRHIVQRILENGSSGVSLDVIECEECEDPCRAEDPYGLISVEAYEMYCRIDKLISDGWEFLFDIETFPFEHPCYTAYIASHELYLEYEKIYDLRYDAMAGRVMYLPIELSMWDWLEQHSQNTDLLQIWTGVY